MTKTFFTWNNRISIKDRKKLASAGFFVYSMRDWDDGRGSTIEDLVVLVNYYGELILSEPIKKEDWDYDDGKGYRCINDAFEFLRSQNFQNAPSQECERFKNTLHTIINNKEEK